MFGDGRSRDVFGEYYINLNSHMACPVGAIAEAIAEIQNAEERLDHLRKSAKFFGENKDRLFEAKVSGSPTTYMRHIRSYRVYELIPLDGRRCRSTTQSPIGVRTGTRTQIPFCRSKR